MYLWETSRGLKLQRFRFIKLCELLICICAGDACYSLDYHPRVGFKINDLFFDFNCRLDSYCNWNFNFSAIVKNSVEDKRAMREAILPCIFKVIIMVAVLWLVY